MNEREIQALMELAANVMAETGHSGHAVQKVLESADLSTCSAKNLVHDTILQRVTAAPEAYWLDSVRGCLIDTKVLPEVYVGPGGSYFITEDTPELANAVPEYTVRQVLVTAPMAKIDVFDTLDEAKKDAIKRSGQ